MKCLLWMEEVIWEEMLWWAGYVRVGDVVCTEFFKWIAWSSPLVVLECSFGPVLECADWFLLGETELEDVLLEHDKSHQWCSTEEPHKSQSKTRATERGWVLSACLFFLQVCCCCTALLANVDTARAVQILPSALMSWCDSWCKCWFQFKSFLQKEKHLKYTQCFLIHSGFPGH